MALDITEKNYGETYGFYVGPKGYSITKKYLTEEEQNKIRSDLTVSAFVPPNSIQKPAPFTIYRESPKKLYVPRFYGFEHFGPPKKYTISQGEDIDIEFEGELREYQVEIVDSYIKETQKSGCGLLELYCGAGKTVQALNIISRLQKKTLIVVHKEFLLNQWVERIEQFLPSAKVGRIQGPTIDVEDKDIVIGMLQSLSMKSYSPDIFAQFGLSVFDECFEYDTRVLTEHGHVCIGDLYLAWKGGLELPKILSYNVNTKKFEYKTLIYASKKKTRNFVNVKYEDAYGDIDSFICTERHKILTTGGYVEAQDLVDLHQIVGYDKDCGGQLYRVRKTTPIMYDEYFEVFDIEVKDNHNFIIKNVFTNVVVSNCHHISAEVFSRSLFKIVTPYMLGLSATMNRKDGLTKVFKMFLGDVVYKLVRDGDDDVTVRSIQYKHSDPEFSKVEYNFKGQTHYAIMIRKLCEFNHRSEFILRVLQDTLEETPDQQIMILAHNKSLLRYLHDAIEHRGIATVGYYVGGMKEAALKETEGKEVVIATYAMAEEALDIKSLATLIMATPKTDVTQAVGRILRMKHKKPLVIDIVDQHDIFQRQWQKRRRFYARCKYKIIQSSSKLYSTKYDLWNVVYDPVNKKKAKEYKRKMKQDSKPNGKLLQGKCILDITIDPDQEFYNG